MTSTERFGRRTRGRLTETPAGAVWYSHVLDVEWWALNVAEIAPPQSAHQPFVSLVVTVIPTP